ncbi:Kunitz/Bovine pancreatic trypsin inhibitor domain protein, partial [Cooperia oncophora]
LQTTSAEVTTVPSVDTSEQLWSTESIESSHETIQATILWQNENPCELPPHAGTPGGVAQKMWHFDESVMTCAPFVFLGTGGNANRFVDSETCMRTCGSGKPTRASCELPSQFGNGTFKIPRYYFDKVGF